MLEGCDTRCVGHGRSIELDTGGPLRYYAATYDHSNASRTPAVWGRDRFGDLSEAVVGQAAGRHDCDDAWPGEDEQTDTVKAKVSSTATHGAEVLHPFHGIECT